MSTRQVLISLPEADFLALKQKCAAVPCTMTEYIRAVLQVAPVQKGRPLQSATGKKQAFLQSRVSELVSAHDYWATRPTRDTDWIVVECRRQLVEVMGKDAEAAWFQTLPQMGDKNRR